MPKINSREKGKRFERELAAVLRAEGYPDARRTAQYCGNSGKAYDIEGVPGLAIEAKHRERMELYEWMAQAVRDSEGSGLLPVVMHRKNNAETLVTMRFSDFLEIFREYANGLGVVRVDECCKDCKEYDAERNACPRWNRVIRSTLADIMVKRHTEAVIDEH